MTTDSSSSFDGAVSNVVFTGSSWVEETESELFIPRLNNAYEQKLYESVLETSGVEYWHIKRFAESQSLPHMQAMETAFNEAVKDAGLQRKIKKKNGGRVGVIYFDEYGPISFMERQAQIKEMYYSDVFPSFVLQAHNISGYSVRFRGERNSPMQAINLAKTLIESGELDVVFVGGVNPCYSFFFLTEQLETQKWEKAQGMRNTKYSETRHLSEAAGFLVLEHVDHAEERGHAVAQPLLHISSSRETYSAKKAASNPLPTVWEKLNNEFDIKRAYMGLYPSRLIEQTENMLLKDTFSDMDRINLCEQKGDANSLNVIRILHEQISAEEPDNKIQLIHSTDRSGFGWNLLTQ